METCKAEKYPPIRKTDTDQLIAQMTVNDAPRQRFPHFLFKLKKCFISHFRRRLAISRSAILETLSVEENAFLSSKFRNDKFVYLKRRVFGWKALVTRL